MNIQKPGIDIQTVAVIGAGAMGSGIAGQLANAGVKVYLLDIIPQDATDRDIVAKSAIQRMLKATPATDPLNAGFMVPENAQRITTGNIEDHLETAVRDADWIVEVVVENLAVKRDLYAKLETLKRADAIVSSNTSTIPLKDLVEGRSDAFKQYFIITHFFNPPRFMHLLEIVAGPQTRPEIMTSMRDFGDFRLGKNVIICKDTPAFLANRIGIFYMFRAINEALDRQMPIEIADAVLGTPIGFPKEGIFGLLDLVGIGIIPLVTSSLQNTLPDDDPFHTMKHDQGLNLVNSLLKEGRWGRNSPKGGFYRMQKKEGGGKQKQATNLETGEYYDIEKVRLPLVKAAKKHGPRAVLEGDDPISHFTWAVVRDTLLYAARLIPEIADDIADVDAALRGGYNAHWGPFELIDQLGVEWFCEKVQKDGLELPNTLKLAKNRSFYRLQNSQPQRLVFDFVKGSAEYRDLHPGEGLLRLSDIKRASQPLVTHYSASLWDIGDGVTCLEFHSKMNTLDPSILWVLNQSLEWMQAHRSTHKAMVIYNEEKNFSLGANLGLIDAGFQASRAGWAKSIGLKGAIENAMFQMTETLIYQGQSVFSAMRHAPFPVVGAPQGMALGGGCEILLHCDALQASSETYMGLVESGVGLVPAWGGCLRYLERCQRMPGLKAGPIPVVRAAFQTILMPQTAVSNSAADARKKLWLSPEDGITMNPDRLLSDAKACALAMSEDYTPPAEVTYRLPGPEGKAALSLAVDDFYAKGDATWHDVVVADALASVLTGGETIPGRVLTENDLAQLEREHFLSLLKTAQTRKRVSHTLKSGKPLREDLQAERQTVETLRAGRSWYPLPQRPITGKPLEGAERAKLRNMARITAFLLKRVSG
jgi:3-hydroxyacyl-CoA dehydrogenase